jgi:hypothetical protein
MKNITKQQAKLFLDHALLYHVIDAANCREMSVLEFLESDQHQLNEEERSMVLAHFVGNVGNRLNIYA